MGGLKEEKPAGPFTLWTNYGAHEGWKFEDFDTVETALAAAGKFDSWTITKPVKYSVAEVAE
jgi:hypothetical protein